VSPASSRAQKRQRRNLLLSVLAVVVIAVGSFSAVFSVKWSPKLGLDLAGGLSVVYQTAKSVSPSELQETVAILNNRVNGLGVSGAEVSTTGANEISVSIPGVKDAHTVLEDIGNTAQLYFRPVECTAYPLTLTKATKATKKTKAQPAEKAISGNKTLPACGSTYATNATNLAVTPNSSVQGYTSNNPNPDPTFAQYTSTSTNAKNYEHRTVLLPSLPGNGTTLKTSLRYVLGPEQMTGTSIASAVAQQSQTGAWEVNYSLKGKAGSTLWDKVAEENFHLLLGIELDGVVQSAPLIQPTQSGFTSFDGQGTINGGNMTEADAKSLALAMNFGSLPVRLKQLTTQTVSPTLGKSALKAGLGAGLVGLGLVLLYVLIYYRALGAVVISGLVLTAGTLWAIISALGHTTFSPSFDLAGITGLIVSIGITVDSYIVYFERLKDETRAGRSIRTSVDRGFKSAWRTVWAADFVSLLAAVVLYLVAVGDVKGFAFFLGLSTIMDMAFTWFYTRPLVILLGRSERLNQPGRFSIARGLLVGGGGAGDGDDGQGGRGPGPGPGGNGSGGAGGNGNGSGKGSGSAPKRSGLIRPGSVSAP
jgi:preprotein translocase subunit SecD